MLCELSKTTLLLSKALSGSSFGPTMTANHFGCLFEHFDHISGSLAAETEVVVRRAGLTAQVVAQQSELINLVLSRSEQSFHRLAHLVQQLCQSLASYNPNEPLVDSAFQELDSEHLAWAELEKSINIRRLRLNTKGGKLREGKVKRASRHREQHSEIRVCSQPDFKACSVKSEPFVKVQSGVSTVGREQIDYQYKSHLKEEFFVVRDFIVRNLAPMLEYAEGNEVPKKIVLNIYMRWNGEVNRKCLIEDTGKIQMELTNQLKICFPRIALNRKAFRGIQFRREFMSKLQLTDRSPPFNEHQQLLECQGPVNQLLREWGEGRAGEGRAGQVESEASSFLKELGEDLDFDE